MRAGIGLAPEERKSQGLWPGWDLVRNVSVADLRRFRRRALLDRRAERAATAAQLRELGTTPADPERLVDELSGGNQQKVVLARWLLHETRVLLLDEPTRGVDIGAKAAIHGIIDDLARKGIAIILISSELPEILGMSDRIAVMHGGRIPGVLDRAAASQSAIAARLQPIPLSLPSDHMITLGWFLSRSTRSFIRSRKAAE